ncbi:sensor histidine kinase [Lutispora thermophila]|uniref:histidine kinase n=1 Tax=Lutispora thermophila DSM 19022 TaxID=1122184 RepID=A0A1M6E3G4_9FIRM|nr:sensor histidine kinase [Lutispora thermophila]SHI79920.1 Signal transduction histidine kinase [Lutispora thermophila DSM 19022]
MKCIIKILLFSYVITMKIIAGSPGFIEISLLLIIIASNVYRDMYKNSMALMIGEAAVILYLSYMEATYIYIYPIMVYDLIQSGYLNISGLLIIPGIIFLEAKSMATYLLLMILCGYFSYISNRIKARERLYREAYDNERRLRYELEKIRAEMLNASKNIEHLAELRERNRIAREIHDSVGHSLAGIMMQLEASYKIWDKDRHKSRELLQNSIKGLSEAIVTLRETVHNIRPKEAMGLEYIENIIKNFNYCAVEFSKKGDMALLKPNHIEIFGQNVKEAFTNILKHSEATKVTIILEANNNYTRLHIKDNGRGCKNIREGLGISGMRERMKYAGGMLSVNGDDGFNIVCIIPMDDGGGIIESANSR